MNRLGSIKTIKKSNTVQLNDEDFEIKLLTKSENKLDLEKLIWLNENKTENILFQGQIMDIKNFEERFDFCFCTKINDCLEILKKMKYEKIYIIISALLAKQFFIELEKIINEIIICPVILIFSSKKKLDPIRNEIINLEKFPLFDINLVYDNINKLKNKLSLLQDKYKSSHIPPIEKQNYDNCFTFEYVNDEKDLIFPLTFVEFMEIPNKIEILNFNQFLLDKYYELDNVEDQDIEALKKLEDIINQLLLIETKIPIQILVKYWIRAYTLQTPFYGELNLTLMKKLNNDFDIFIRVLYQGLMAKAIKPVIDKTLYRGSVIKLEEINKIKESLNNKKKNIPECICFNKAFLSTSQNKNVALGFMKNPNQDEMRVLYIFEKKGELDNENATNFIAQDFSSYKKEEEVIFFPYSCFQINSIKIDKINNLEYCEINLGYIGKYKNQININQKIPDNEYTKTILSSNVLEKLEMGKESNKDKFDFNIEKYIPPEIKQSFIMATYDISINDINKKIQILNYDEKIGKKELENICNIYLDNKKIEFNLEYTFNKPRTYTFTFEFNELLTNANKLFYGCNCLISLNFSKFKSNYIKDLTDMFNGCSNLTSLDLSNFKTNEVYSMKGLFKNCNSLKILDISSFNTNNVIDMSEMFCGCYTLTYLNLSNFNTQKVKTMNKMFYNCNSLFYINLSNFQSDKVNNTSEMFSDCTSLNYLDLSLFEINDKINTEKMFFNCAYFKSLIKEFISEINDINLANAIKRVSETFFSVESEPISKDIQFFVKNKNYQNIEILIKSIEEFINEIKSINILVLGENQEEREKLIKEIIKEKKGDINLVNENEICSKDGYLKLYECREMDNNKIKNKYDNLNKKFDSRIHFIWFCITDININNNENVVLNDLIKNYENIYFFIIYSNTKEEENNLIKLKKDLTKIFTNKNFEIIPFSYDNIKENINEIINKTKNNFINIIYQYILNNSYLMEKVKDNIKRIKPEKDLDDLPKSLSNYFENLLGKRNDINQYLYKSLKTMLNYSKRGINADTINDLIETFKKEKLKLKVTETKSKKIDIENLDDELSNEIKKKYNKISQRFYELKFKEKFFTFFSNFLKEQSEKIISQSIKVLKLEDLKPLIEKNLIFKKD